MLDKLDLKDCKIFFADRHVERPYSKKTSIVLSPVDSRWNDFKHKFHYEYQIFFDGYERHSTGNVFLGFVEKDSRFDNDGLISTNGELLPAEDFPDFFTMAGSMEDYRKIIYDYTEKEGKQLLLALNDLVALKRKSQSSDLVKQAEKTSVFRLAFMRSGENYFAYNNAYSVLDGLEDEDIGAMSTKLGLKFKLDRFESQHDIKFKFDPRSILPKRINVIIGKNGLGKSQALNRICQSLLKGDGGLYDLERDRPLINRLLAIASPGETINTFPRERASKRVKYRKLVLGSQAKSKSTKGIGESIVQLARSEDYIAGSKRWDIFERALKGLPDFHSVAFQMDSGVSVYNTNTIPVDNKYYAFLWSMRKGGEQAMREIWGAIEKSKNPVQIIDDKAVPLSSGQVAFLKFAVQACTFIENGTLVLLDEPETHLHPNFISDFVRLLDQLLEATGSLAIIATHSAYFVREVPSEQVSIITSSDNSIDILKPRLKTFGANVGAISYFIFEDEIANNLIEKLRDQFPDNKDLQIEKLNELRDSLSSDVLMHLQRYFDVVL